MFSGMRFGYALTAQGRCLVAGLETLHGDNIPDIIDDFHRMAQAGLKAFE